MDGSKIRVDVVLVYDRLNDAGSTCMMTLGTGISRSVCEFFNSSKIALDAVATNTNTVNKSIRFMLCLNVCSTMMHDSFILSGIQ